MTALRQDFTIEKGSQFYKVLQTAYSDGTARSLVGKNIQCIIKESLSTETKLHDLTEANGRVTVIDDANGQFSIFIPADETNVSADHAVYQILEIDDGSPDDYVRRIMEGKITYTKGLNT